MQTKYYYFNDITESFSILNLENFTYSKYFNLNSKLNVTIPFADSLLKVSFLVASGLFAYDLIKESLKLLEVKL